MAAAQGQLVLQDPSGRPKASSRPTLTAAPHRPRCVTANAVTHRAPAQPASLRRAAVTVGLPSYETPRGNTDQGDEDHHDAAAGKNCGGAGVVDEKAAECGSQGSCREKYGAACGQDGSEELGRCAFLKQSEGKCGVWTVDKQREVDGTTQRSRE